MKKHFFLDLIYNPASFSALDREHAPLFQRSRKPFEKLASGFDEFISKFSIQETQIEIVASKIENACKKILMMSKAGIKATDCEKEIMAGQDREYPVLIWDDEIELLYHLEAMILFGRSALDIVAYMFSTFLLNKRIDSFHKFRQSIMKATNPHLSKLEKALKSEESVETSWLNILCGNEKGRSIRDKVAHQTIAKIEYETIKPNDDDLYCHIVIGNRSIPLEKFIKEVNEGVINFCILAEDVTLSAPFA